MESEEKKCLDQSKQGEKTPIFESAQFSKTYPRYYSTETNKQLPSAEISVHDVSYSIVTGSCLRKHSKRILTDVSGIFKPGLNAIMGPSGSGKTTLLDVLAQRKRTESLEGFILLNGQPFPQNFTFLSGYVAQDDVISLALTVQENLMFSASLRMRDCTHAERVRRVEQLVAELGLDQCQHTTIGDPFSSGISGGERKRCCIGMELVNQPPVVFLDEPTTGLDSSTAFSVISVLKRLSTLRNSTFIITIHQPRFSIYSQFGRLHLLSQSGQTVFHGPANEALSYFEQLGYVCEDYYNPAEFFLDLMLQSVQLSAFSPGFESQQAPIKTLSLVEHTANQSNIKDLVKCFRASELNKVLHDECETVLASEEGHFFDSNVKFSRSWFTQLHFLTMRNLKGFKIFPGKVIASWVVVFLISAMLGFLLFDWKYDKKGFENINGVLFFFVVVVVFGNFECLNAMLGDREIFIVESQNGYYRVSAHLLAKLLGDVIPRQTSKITVFALCLYFFLNLKPSIDSFLLFFSAGLLTCIAAVSLFVFVAAFTGRFGSAAALLPAISVMMIFVAGFFANVGTLPPVLAKLKYASIVWYAMSLLTTSQFRNVEFCDSQKLVAENGSEISPYLCERGESYLDRYSVNYSFAGCCLNFIGLAAFSLFFYVLTYFSWLRTARSRK